MFGAALACRPFSDDPKTAAETILSELAPKLGTIQAAAVPFPLQPWQSGCQTAFVDAEDIFALATQNMANELATEDGSADDTLIGRPSSAIVLSIRLVCWRRRKPSYCSLSAAVSSAGSSVLAR